MGEGIRKPAAPVTGCFGTVLTVIAASLLPLHAMASEWLIATRTDTVRAGERFSLEAVRPEQTLPWPSSLMLRITSGTQVKTILMLPEKPGSSRSIRRGYQATIAETEHGLLKIELAEMASNRLLLEVAEPVEPVAASTAGAPPETDWHAEHRLEPIPENEPALSAYEPVYFVAGLRKGLNARFQLSFKYRLFDQDSTPVEWFAPLENLHFGYTQTTLWDLRADSKPFRDTSYRPSLFWQSKLAEEPGSPAFPSYLRVGYEHESNGKDGISSRSIDTYFVQPAWRKDFSDGNSLFFAPRFSGYLDRSNNPDIARYRGYIDWLFRFGDESGWLLTSRMRTGTAGHLSSEVDVSVPLRKPLFSRTGGFLYFQLYNGYGESMLDYNYKNSTQLRVGYAIVR